MVYAVEVSEEITGNLAFPRNVRLLLSDGTSIPVPDASVAVAYSNQLMEHLHPDDAAVVREKLAAPQGEQQWQLSEDPLMARGGCRVTSDNSSIDARFETAVASALSGLLGDDRAERPDGEK